MKKLRVLIVSSIVFLSLFITSFYLNDSVHADEGDKFYVWLITDQHFIDTYTDYVDDPTAYEAWVDAIEDSEEDWDFDWDIAVVIGDVTNGGTSAQYQNFSDVLLHSSGSHNREDFYVTTGNHDVYQGTSGGGYFSQYIDPEGDNSGTSGVNNSRRKFPISNVSGYEESYTFQVGNTLFVVCGTIFTGDDNDYNNAWVEARLDGASEDVNIIGFSHHPVDNSGVTVVSARPYFMGIDDWFADNPGRVDGWFNGHKHYDEPYGDTFYVFNATTWGTFFMNAGAFHDGEDLATAHESVILTFTQGSTTVQASSYFHGHAGSQFSLGNGNEGWDGDSTTRGNHTFELDNAFDYFDDIPEEEISFVSINGLSNNNVTQNTSRCFNWTKVDGATMYQLRISNSSSFDTTFFNMTIDSGNYTVKGEYVEYILPENISWYGYHYYQVRAYTST